MNLLTIDAGLIFALPGIVIPALTGILNEHNRNEFLTITAHEAAWMGMVKPRINSTFLLKKYFEPNSLFVEKKTNI